MLHHNLLQDLLTRYMHALLFFIHQPVKSVLVSQSVPRHLTARWMSTIAFNLSRFAAAILSILHPEQHIINNTYVSQLTDRGRFLLPEVPLWLRSTTSSPLEPSSLQDRASGECCDSLDVPLGLPICCCAAAPLVAGVALMANSRLGRCCWSVQVSSAKQRPRSGELGGVMAD